MGGDDDQEGGEIPMSFAYPPGFRFEPSDEEMVSYYLKGKNENEGGSPTPTPTMVEGLIVEYDIYSCDPWDLPRDKFRYPGTQTDMYFFTPTGNGQGKRRSRTAGCGVWHGHGRDNLIKGWDDSQGRLSVLGHKTSFKFEVISEAEASTSTSEKKSRIKTDWLMHEYRLQPATIGVGVGVGGRDAVPRPRFVLSRIYQKEKAAASGAWEHQGVDVDVDDDCDSLQPPQHHPQPKRKRPVEEPPEQAMSPADAAGPFSPDTPSLLSWPTSSGLTLEDQRPSPKRRRVVHVQPEEEPEQHRQQEHGSSDAAFATLSPPPSSAPDAQLIPAHQPGSPSSSSSWDDLSSLELDALLFADGLPSPPSPPDAQLMPGAVNSAASDHPGCPSSDVASSLHQLDDQPCSPPQPSPAPADALLLTVTGVDTAAASDQPGCPSSPSSDLASSLQQLQGLLNSPPPPSSSPFTSTGFDPLQHWSEFADDWRFDPYYAGFPALLDDPSFALPSF